MTLYIQYSEFTLENQRTFCKVVLQVFDNVIKKTKLN